MMRKSESLLGLLARQEIKWSFSLDDTEVDMDRVATVPKTTGKYEITCLDKMVM